MAATNSKGTPDEAGGGGCALPENLCDDLLSAYDAALPAGRLRGYVLASPEDEERYETPRKLLDATRLRYTKLVPLGAEEEASAAGRSVPAGRLVFAYYYPLVYHGHGLTGPPVPSASDLVASLYWPGEDGATGGFSAHEWVVTPRCIWRYGPKPALVDYLQALPADAHARYLASLRAYLEYAARWLYDGLDANPGHPADERLQAYVDSVATVDWARTAEHAQKHPAFVRAVGSEHGIGLALYEHAIVADGMQADSLGVYGRRPGFRVSADALRPSERP